MRSATSCVRGIAQLLVGGLFAALSTGALSASSVVTEGSKAWDLMAEGKGCVDDTPVIRRNHMVFLKHQRDETVHNGIRGAKHSLAGCVNCHASKGASGTPEPVNGEGQFCQTCHSYAAVSIDCFQCHRTIPSEEASSAQPPAVGRLDSVDLEARAGMLWVSQDPARGSSGPQTVNPRD